MASRCLSWPATIRSASPSQVPRDVCDGGRGRRPCFDPPAGISGRDFDGKVTRTSLGIDAKNRTLRTEIDVPNPKATLRPGLYALATIVEEHPNVLTCRARPSCEKTLGPSASLSRMERSCECRLP